MQKKDLIYLIIIKIKRKKLKFNFLSNKKFIENYKINNIYNKFSKKKLM